MYIISSTANIYGLKESIKKTLVLIKKKRDSHMNNNCNILINAKLVSLI